MVTGEIRDGQLVAGASRRLVLRSCLAIAATSVSTAAGAQSEGDPAKDMRPQPGDLLVFFDGEHEGAVVKPTDLKRDAPQELAWAFDPVKKIARDGSRLNMVVLMRFDPTTLGPTEAPRAAEGVVAYSAICTHQQCTVTDWLKTKQVMRCPCHQSEYDPRHGARVVGGPAPRSLPALPLKIADGALTVAAPFTSRVGGEKL